jgi:CubicO group peptidase (beta-lactamase class C family)
MRGSSRPARQNPGMTTESLLHLVREAVAEHIDGSAVPGAVMAVCRDGDVQIDALGTAAVDTAASMPTDAVMRISSMTKPLAAALTLVFVEDGILALDDPVERWVPELAGRHVLRRLDGPLDDTVPAARPITVDDLLTLRMGFGFVLDSACPVLDLAAEAGLGIGPPDPSIPLSPDAWIAQFAKLPLMHQPGEDWRYEFGFGVLGVVLARAARIPLDALLSMRLLDPLGMVDTGFVVPPRALHRLVPCYTHAPDGGLAVFDGTEQSRWSVAPAFPDARGGLVSTAADYLRFARMLLAGGVQDGVRLLSESSIAVMTSDHLSPEQRQSSSAATFLSGGGWGYGMEVVTPEHDLSVRTRRYGWGGGLGTTWYSFPDRNTTAVLLTQCLPPAEALVNAFWSALRRALDA